MKKIFITTTILGFLLLTLRVNEVQAAETNICSLPVTAQSTLASYAANRNFTIGTLITECFNPSINAAQRITCQQLVAREYTNMRLSVQVPWSAMEPTQGIANYTKFDEMLAFARSIGAKVHYYHLIWTNHGAYTNPPAWVFPGRTQTNCGSRTKAELEIIMKTRIQNMIKRGGDTVDVWSVVNEAFGPNGALVQDCFFKIIGPDYIDKAFQYARETSPQTLLILNDFFHDLRPGNSKVDGFFQYVKAAKSRGIPIDAVGLQNHLWKSDGNYFAPSYLEGLQYFFNKAKDAGVSVLITEMDVYQQNRSQTDVKRVYKDTAAACLTNSQCLSLSTWGTSDEYSWMHGFHPPLTPDPKPLLFDQQYKRKPAYYGVMEAIRENKTRPCTPSSNPADLTDEGDTPGDEVNIFDYNVLIAGFGTTYDIFDYNTLVGRFGE